MPKPEDQRRNPRRPVAMLIRSASLPSYQARLTDLSQSGARIVLKGAPSSAMQEQRIRFAASLIDNERPCFEGFARIVWVLPTARGWEAGLEWERLAEDQWCRVRLTANAA